MPLEAIATTEARNALFRRFQSRIQVNTRLDRTLVSFQANRRTPIFNWFKYKEGFSAELVRRLIESFGNRPGVLLDPFAGSGTALFTARDLGWDSIGIELLPVGFHVMQARLAAEIVKPKSFNRYLQLAECQRWEEHYDQRFALRHIPITDGAFTPDTERAIAGYRAWCERFIKNAHVRKLFDFACFCILEEVSFTRKDGQYLRWDSRSPTRNLKSRFSKGNIPTFASALLAKLHAIHNGLPSKNNNIFPDLFSGLGGNGGIKPRCGSMDLRRASCLEALPEMADDSIELVITSPPYCNRYDYTRTYALELIYLGYSAEEVSQLRQTMLSCTVENRTKVSELRDFYHRFGKVSAFENARSIFEQQKALHEVLQILDERGAAGELNNSNIPKMVRNYFFEMCLVIGELTRVLRPGGRIVMVNDNVRYAGEEVPVDLILSNMAQAFGLSVDKIWTLTRGKGNSSQQMGAHGRTELRKCVYVWEKPSHPFERCRQRPLTKTCSTR